ncbi:hypothetical protein, partial [uncultured Desulfovibrio sp.]|uniref:hypothetical protein n=1 Tax=uncultured Desulfovibrio sp. TaxID=167968 RepID=UPI002607A74C
MEHVQYGLAFCGKARFFRSVPVGRRCSAENNVMPKACLFNGCTACAAGGRPGKGEARGRPCRFLEQFQFEMLRISNHTACRFAEKTRFFRSLRAGRRCA